MTVVTNRSWRRSLILGLLIGLGLLILVLSQLSLKQAWQNLAQLDGRRLLLPLLVTLVCQPFRPWRWQAIFPKDVRPGFWSCFSVLAVGLMTNNFLPGRGGDLLRCFLVNRKVTLAGASLVLATLGLEKVLDGLALLAVVLLSFWFFSPPQWLGQLELASGLHRGPWSSPASPVPYGLVSCYDEIVVSKGSSGGVGGETCYYSCKVR
jgi:uncharacterized membrane protein YbhN (UPF0104 family)